MFQPLQSLFESEQPGENDENDEEQQGYYQDGSTDIGEDVVTVAMLTMVPSPQRSADTGSGLLVTTLCACNDMLTSCCVI